MLGLAALCALRLPTNRVQLLNVDEADFAIEAGSLLDGGRPYIDFVEKKPPLIYVLYAGAMGLVGRYNLIGFRILLIGYVLASALVLAAIARRLFGLKPALIAIPAYALAVSTGLPMDMHAANPETLFLLPLLVGTWLSLSRGPTNVYTFIYTNKRLFLAGVCIGLGSLIKQQAGMQLAIVGAYVFFAGSEAPLNFAQRVRARATPIAILGSGFAAIWGVALAGLASVGSLGEFYYWTIEVNRYYIANGNTLHDSLRLLVRAVGTLIGFSPWLWLLGFGNLVRELIVARKKFLLIALWLFGSMVPIALGGRYFGHYFLQLIPPLVLLAAKAIADLWDWASSQPRIRLAAASALAAMLVVFPIAKQMPVFLDPDVLQFPHALSDARTVAAYVRENSPSDARLLVWGYGSALYYLAERKPATRFPYVTYLVGAVEGTPSWWSPFSPSRPLEIARAWDLLFADLERHPPQFVIDTSKPGYFGFFKFPPSKYPRLLTWLQTNYRETEVAHFPLWVRKQRGE